MGRTSQRRVIFKNELFTIYERDRSRHLQLYCKIRGLKKPIQHSLETDVLEDAVHRATKEYYEAVNLLHGITKDLTLQEGVDWFLKYSQKDKTKAGHDNDVYYSRIVLKFFDPSRSMSSVRVFEVQEFQSFLKKHRGVSTTTINRYMAFLSGVYTQAKRSELYTGNNPVQAVERAPEDNRKDTVPPEKMKEVMTFAKQISGAVFRPTQKTAAQFYFYAYLLLVSSAIRPSEIFRLRFPDIHENYIMVPLGKNKRSRIVPVSRKVIGILLKLPKGSNEMWVIDTPTRDHSAFRSWWDKLKEACKLGPRVVPYTLRHSFGTHSGLDLRQKQGAMGHSNIETTTLYEHSNVMLAQPAIEAYQDQYVV